MVEESRSVEQWVADVIARIEATLGRAECYCTGVCRPNPENCPALRTARMTFAERVEDLADMAEKISGIPERAKLLRAALTQNTDAIAEKTHG